MISKNNKLGDVLVDNQALLQVIYRLGINLGFGDKTIEEIANDYNIDVDFLVELINLIILNGKYNSKFNFNFKTDLTIKYLKNSHFAYLNDYLIRIKEFILKLEGLDISRKQDIVVLSKIFNNYHSDFAEHLDYEDNVIFPYVKELELSLEQNNFTEELLSKIENHSVKEYSKKHDSLFVKINDLKSLLVKYFKPFPNELEIINGLNIMYEFENDLKKHELIENNILFPKVISMENSILKKIKLN